MELSMIHNFQRGPLTLEIRHGNGLRGRLRIGRRGVEWCRGRTRPGNGVKTTWEEFLRWLERARS